MAGPPKITDEMIARRAFEISLTEPSATPEENWERAERELREEAARAARQADDDQS
jgi:hypothetical protein